MKVKKFLRLISIVLMIALSSQLLPVFASNNNESSSLLSESVLQETPQATPEIVEEIIDKREENVKYFLMSDGSFMCAQYETAVHYFDQGEWKDIDNSLVLKEATNENEINGYVASGNNLDFKFAENSNAEELLNIKNGNYEISWKVLNTDNTVNASVVNSSATLNQEDLSNIKSSITYNNIFTDVDLQYELIGNKIKENIIINSPKNSYNFEFELALQNLSPIVNADSSIGFVSESGDVIFNIPAPFMYDATGNISKNVSYTVEAKEVNKYMLKIVVDNEWINSSTFPVTVDPQMTTGDSNFSLDIFSISEKENKVITDPMLWVGYVMPDYFQTRIIAKPTLPTGINGDDVITEARLNLNQYHNFTNNDPLNVSLNRITESWDKATLTWQNKPAYDSTISECTYIGTENGEKSFDITSLVKAWQTGEYPNYGVMFKLVEEVATTSTNALAFYAPNNNIDNSLSPYMKLFYRNNRGVEDYLTYHVVDLGKAGTAYINDYSGNLVLVNNEIQAPGNRMGVSLSHVYNSAAPVSKSASNFYINEMKTGNNWKLDVQEKITGLGSAINSSYRYVYVDGDGTEHYLKYVKTEGTKEVYIDEEGLELNLVWDSSQTYDKYFTLEKDGIVKTFNGAGYLTKIINKNGDELNYYYSGVNYVSKTISRISDSLSRNTNFTYTAGKLSKITGLDNRELNYQYDTLGNLTQISYPDNTTVTYTYDAQSRMASAVDNETGRGVTFTYTSGKITGVSEFGNAFAGTTKEVGQEVSVNYSTRNSTVYRMPGNDGILNNSDDILTTYTFDNYGRTICTYSQNLTGSQEYGANGYSYNTELFNPQNNTIKTSVSSGKNIYNYLKHDNSSWTGSSSSCTYETVKKLSGVKSLKVFRAIALDEFTGFSAAFAPAQSSKHTFSGYIKTESLNSDLKGAFLSVVNNQTGAVVVTSDYVTGTTTQKLNNGWTRVSCTFDATIGTGYTLKAGVVGSTGTAYFDGFQLEKGDCATPLNLIYNGGFNNDDTGWQCSTGIYTTIASTRDGTEVLSVTGSPSEIKKAEQTITINSAPNSTFTLSGWGRAQAVYGTGNASFALKATLKYTVTDKVTGQQRIIVQEEVVPFNRDSQSWQYTSGTIVPIKSNDEYTVNTLNTITVACDYSHNANRAFFENVSLIRDIASYYEYDQNGNLTQVDNLDGNGTTMAYDTQNNLTNISDNEGKNTNITYDQNGNISNVNSSDEKYSTAYTYDQNKNISSAVVQNSNNTQKMYTSFGYSNSGDYQSSVTDARGITSQQTYNVLTGTLASETDGNGNRKNYVYNTLNDRITQIYADLNKNGQKDAGETDNTYSYTNGNLSQIGHNGFNYNFEYDSFGNLISTSVGNVNLVSQEYYKNGKLKKSTYGNSDVIENVYDNLDRLVEIKYNGIVKYKWVYNDNNQIVSHSDYVSGCAYEYKYDADGIYRGMFSSDLNIIPVYDDNGKQTGVKYSKGSTQISYVSTTDQNDKLLTYTLPSSAVITPTKDDFGRVTQKTLKQGSRTILSETYSYLPGAGGVDATTDLVQSISYGTNKTLSYTYDNVGNILTISENNVLKESYEYDSLNQVVRENSATRGWILTFTYDAGGNITERRVYRYNAENLAKTTAILNAEVPVATRTYGYDATWKDLLVNYNGQTITYDEIGNPLTYRSGINLSWQNGRQLASFNNTSGSATYKYNSNGLRTSKTVNGETTKFALDGTKIIFQTTTNGTMYFMYDENGSPVGMNYLGQDYYYRKNLQGDIIEIVNSSGVVVVKYVYDMYGKVESITDTSGELVKVGTANPFRYRGYYYDNESGFYYLQSRYYDPVTGRFLNADDSAILQLDQAHLGQYNLFAYCLNNPVNGSDHKGYFPSWKHGLMAIGLVVSFGLPKGAYRLSKWLWLKITALLSSTKIALFAGQFIFAAGFLATALIFITSIGALVQSIRSILKHVKYAFDWSSWHQGWWNHG